MPAHPWGAISWKCAKTRAGEMWDISVHYIYPDTVLLCHFFVKTKKWIKKEARILGKDSRLRLGG